MIEGIILENAENVLEMLPQIFGEDRMLRDVEFSKRAGKYLGEKMIGEEFF